MDFKVLLNNLKHCGRRFRAASVFLSVVAGLNGKWTRIFALIERRSFEKKSEHQNHNILFSTPTSILLFLLVLVAGMVLVAGLFCTP